MRPIPLQTEIFLQYLKYLCEEKVGDKSEELPGAILAAISNYRLGEEIGD